MAFKFFTVPRNLAKKPDVNSGDFDSWLQQVQTSRVAAPMLGGLGSSISSVLFGQEADTARLSTYNRLYLELP